MAPGQATLIRRRIIRLAWGAIRILWFAVATILTRRFSVKTLAGLVPAIFRRTCMSDTVKLDRKSVKGVVEKVNPRGILIGGTWYDYSRSFEGDKPSKEIVGQEVDLALAESKTGRQFIQAFEVCGEIVGNPEGGDEPADGAQAEGASPGDPSGETPAKADEPATPNQVKYVESLRKETELTDEDLEQLCQIRFKKSFADLTKREASQTIGYLGGGDSRGRARRNGNQQ
jgi:hypothetical protein